MESILALSQEAVVIDIVLMLIFLSVLISLIKRLLASTKLYSKAMDTNSYYNAPQNSHSLKKISKNLAPSVQGLSPHYLHKSSQCFALAIIEKNIANFVSGTALGKVKIDYINHIGAEANPSVDVCPTWLDNAISELLGNAFKHNRCRDDLRIEVTVYLEEDYFLVAVSDNGHGISSNITDKLLKAAGEFSPLIDTVYSQLDGPTNLFSIQSHLRQMRGGFTVRSARQFLTKIILKLPLNASVKSLCSDASTSQSFNQGASETHPANILSAEQEVLSPETLAIEECISDYYLRQHEKTQSQDLLSQKFSYQFTKLLEKHYHDETFKRPQAADIMLMSEKTFARRVRKHYKMSFVEALRKFRLQKARDKLMQGEQITCVAFDTGFSSASYFTQCFRAEFGFAPSQLSKTLQDRGEGIYAAGVTTTT